MDCLAANLNSIYQLRNIVNHRLKDYAILVLPRLKISRNDDISLFYVLYVDKSILCVDWGSCDKTSRTVPRLKFLTCDSFIALCGFLIPKIKIAIFHLYVQIVIQVLGIAKRHSIHQFRTVNRCRPRIISHPHILLEVVELCKKSRRPSIRARPRNEMPRRVSFYPVMSTACNIAGMVHLPISTSRS